MKLKDTCSLEYDQCRQHIKKQRHYFADKGPSSQSYGFFSSHVKMWALDHKESWAPKNWCFWTVVLESPLDCKKIKPINPKGNQYWTFIGRTDAEAETPILWPPHPLSSPSPPTFNLSQHQGLFQWVSSLHQVAKVLEFQLQHQSFQWMFSTDSL